MAKFGCKCGEILSNSAVPNEIELNVYTDVEWDAIINKENFDPLNIPLPKQEVWRCPNCERLYFFKDNELVKTYALEKD